jgi:hypothetical protein
MVGLFGALTRDPLLYLTRGEAQALAWLESNLPENALILAAPETGLLIPARTGRRVLYGHPYETVDAEAEKAQVTGFFQGDLSSPSAFLEHRHVDYIFYGPRERGLGTLPDRLNLRQVYAVSDPGAGDVIIFQVAGVH